MKLASDLDPDLHCNVQYAGDWSENIEEIIVYIHIKIPSSIEKSNQREGYI